MSISVYKVCGLASQRLWTVQLWVVRTVVGAARGRRSFRLPWRPLRCIPQVSPHALFIPAERAALSSLPVSSVLALHL